MSIKIYKFNYDITTDMFGYINDNYVENAKNFIRNEINNPIFEFPKYFRCSVTYSAPELINSEESYNWQLDYLRMIDGEEISGTRGDIVETSNYERYTYNNKEIPLEYPETQLTDKLGFEEFHAIEKTFTVMIYNKNNRTYTGLPNTIIRCNLTIRYSDDNSSAGNRPRKMKKIYLGNSNFSSRISRRNKSSRRKYRNRY